MHNKDEVGILTSTMEALSPVVKVAFEKDAA
jgi:hypothetical protein